MTDVKGSPKDGDWRPCGFNDSSGIVDGNDWRHELDADIRWINNSFDIGDVDIDALNGWVIKLIKGVFEKEQLDGLRQRYFNLFEGSIDIEYDDGFQKPEYVISVHITPINTCETNGRTSCLT